jgi:hypothetical protein
MTTPTDSADPGKQQPEDRSQTSGPNMPTSRARGDDLRDDDDETRDDDSTAGEQVSQVAEPTTEQRPGELPDESQGPP